jgi:biotin synthase
MSESGIRHDWSPAEVENLCGRPLLDLVHEAQRTHRRHHDPRAIQRCTLLSIKTGGCPEGRPTCAGSTTCSSLPTK